MRTSAAFAETVSEAGRSFALADMVRDVLNDTFRGPEAAAKVLRDKLKTRVGEDAEIYVFGQYCDRGAVVLTSTVSCLITLGSHHVRDQIQALTNPAALRSTAFGIWELSPEAVDTVRKAPRVLLLNPQPPGFDHVPAPVLGLNTLISFIRAKRLARIELIDFKLGEARDLLGRTLADFDPQIVGVSIDFDEFEEATTLLTRCQQPGRILVAGNYIARIQADALLNQFPNLVIAGGEGEQFLLDLVDQMSGHKIPDGCSGMIQRCESTGAMIRTRVRPICLDDAILPAPDTFTRLAGPRAAVTMELSRGCSYNACTFCPRDHKSRQWRAASVPASLDAIEQYAEVFDVIGIAPRRIYFVDEEFIGYSAKIDPTERISELAQGLTKRKLNIAWEINTRVDQIFHPGRSVDWHLARWRALAAACDAGLERILIGVESGSDSVFHRFVKGQSVEQTILAMRALSALGINIRVTFITYDQLMSAAELTENFLFLGREDALLKPWPGQIDRALFDEVLNGSHRAGHRVFEKVPYLHNTMKPLPDSHFFRQIQRSKSKEKWSGDYRTASVGHAAVLGARWMEAANRMTMALISTPSPGESNDCRLKAMARVHQASYAALGIVCQIADKATPSAAEAASLEAEAFGITWQINGEVAARSALGHLFDIVFSECSDALGVQILSAAIHEKTRAALGAE